MADLDPLMRRRGADCLSDLELDRLLLGELSRTPAEVRARGHLAGCAPCSARFQELEQLQGSFSSPVPLRLAFHRRAATRRAAFALATAGVAAAAAFLLVPRSALDGTRFKGGDALSVVVRRPDGIVDRVLPGGEVHPGDSIRFEVSTRRKSQVSVVGLDAAGQVSSYFPSPGQESTLPAGPHQLLAGSILLDDTLGPERLFSLFCDTALSPGQALEAARQALQTQEGHPERVLRLEVPCRQATFLIVKRPKP